jgi:hypothetical protein
MRLFNNIPHKLELSVIDLYGKYVSGLLVNYEVRKCSDNSIVYSGVMSEISLVYTKEITLVEVGEYRIKYITPEGYENGFENITVDNYSNYKTDISALALDSTVAKETTLVSTMAELDTKIELIKQIESGRWKIDTTTNQMLFFKEDNVTEIMRFNLKDKDGIATSTAVTERIRQ